MPDKWKITLPDGTETIMTDDEYKEYLRKQEQSKKEKQATAKSQELVTITFTAPRELREKLEAKARADDRTLSSYMRKILSDHAK